MKVVVVDPWHFTPPYDRELCKGLVEAGHQVTFVKSSDDEAGMAGAEVESLGLTTLNLFSTPASWLPRSLELVVKGGQHIRGMLRLLGKLRAIKPDVIHLQWLSLPLVDMLFLPLFRRIAPIVLTVHDSNPFNGAGPWLLRAGSTLAMHRCDQFIVHNKISEQRLKEQGFPVECVHQIAHGLLEQGVGYDDRPAVRTDHRIHFLQFGKLKAYKGADVFLKAVSLLAPKDRAKCHVSIVGRPYIDTQPLVDLVAQHDMGDMVDLRFDFVSDADMAALLAETDFLVFPYRDIDTSGVLMAAAARGIPVIASDIGCFSEMLTDGDEGVLVPPGDPERLASALAVLMAAPEKRASMAVNMKALRERIPSWHAIAKATATVYGRAQVEPESQPIRAHT